MFPILVFAIGIAVLVFGSRLAVLGAAVGALLGLGLLRLVPGSATPVFELALVGGLTLTGFFGARLAKRFVDMAVSGLGALAGFALVLGFLDLLGINLGLMDWLLAALGGGIGLVTIRRARRGSKDWGLIILAGLVGALLVTRGLTIWLPSLQGALGTLLVVLLAGASIAYHAGYRGRRAAAPTVVEQVPPASEPAAPSPPSAPAAPPPAATE